jgi:Tfp pilus assembly PilM family ATPase
MTKRELDKALEFEVPELVSFPVESPKDICYDYFINWQDDREVEVVVVACSRQHLNPYIRAFRESDLRLSRYDGLKTHPLELEIFFYVFRVVIELCD